MMMVTMMMCLNVPTCLHLAFESEIILQKMRQRHLFDFIGVVGVAVFVVFVFVVVVDDDEDDDRPSP